MASIFLACKNVAQTLVRLNTKMFFGLLVGATKDALALRFGSILPSLFFIKEANLNDLPEVTLLLLREIPDTFWSMRRTLPLIFGFLLPMLHTVVLTLQSVKNGGTISPP